MNNIFLNNNENISLNKNEEIDVKSALNIPKYDPKRFPPMSEKDMVEAYGMIYKLQLVSASYDKNLQTLVMKLYYAISKYITKDSNIETIKSAMDNIKNYCKEIKSPLLMPTTLDNTDLSSPN